MDTEDLELVEGMPHKAIIRKLQKANIAHRIDLEQGRYHDSHYYIDSSIRVDERAQSRTLKLLGEGDIRHPLNEYYLAKYKPKPDFDLSLLNGIISFDNGRILERTTVQFVNADIL